MIITKNILAQGLGFVENETESSSMKQEAITSTPTKVLGYE